VTRPSELGAAAPAAATGEVPEAVAPVAHTPRWHGLRQTAALYACVAAGSVIGGVLRAAAGLAALALLGPGFPWGTLFANLTGSFAIGFYATLSEPDGRLFASSRQRQFVMTGICGGYTTFSVFSLETLRLLQAGDAPSAGLNVGVSVVAWLAAVWLGHALAARLNRLKGG
jgi:CrcB protein